jgi:hypothetical protein
VVSPRARRARPCEHLEDPALFGHDLEVTWVSFDPDSGQPGDMQLARLQHELARALRRGVFAADAAPNASRVVRAVRETLNIPRSTWSDYLTGQQWMPSRVLAATAVFALEPRPSVPRP